MKTLILYSTRDGQTREIAERIVLALQDRGIDTELRNLHSMADIDWRLYDKVVIGASIRYGHFHAALADFTQKHTQALNERASAFFSVNLVARKPEKRTAQTNAYTHKFLINTSWHPDISAVFAGALRYPRYRWYDRFMIRLIMKMTGGETDTRKEVVYTDWESVTLFAQNIAQLAYKKCAE